MRISSLLNPDISTLILQSKDDKTTRLAILQQELSEMKDFNNLKVEFFEGPGHVKLFQEKSTQHQYIKSVSDFLYNTSIESVKNK